MYIPIQLLEEDELDLRKIFFDGGGTAVLEYDEGSAQNLYVVVLGGGITPSGALANVNNANAITPSGGITPSGDLPLILRGDDSMIGGIAPTGSLVGVSITLAILDLTDLNQLLVNGDLILLVQMSPSGGISPTGGITVPTNMHAVAGSIAPSGAITGNTVSTPGVGSGAGSRRRRR